MNKRIICFMPGSDNETIADTLASLGKSGLVDEKVVFSDEIAETELSGVSLVRSAGFASTKSLKEMGRLAKAEFVLIYTKSFRLDLGRFALQRMIQVCEASGAGMVYSDYYANREGRLTANPVIDYQEGSLRDDFNFGSLMLFNASAFREACASMDRDFKSAGLYDLRLRVSQKYRLVHIPELLYTEVESDLRKSGEKQFDYVDPKNRDVQIEMEIACTDHLKAVKAFLKPEFTQISFDEGSFDFEASVIIPVRNRVKTLGDAVSSVLSQKCSFRFNLIIIDNHSSDGTTELIKEYSGKDSRIVHLIPERKDLGIGGCWNEGIFDRNCGRFAIQLDSDDLYIDNDVITRIVEAFYSQKCAMVVGSYKMVNFNLQDIPPGLIDHKEWTPDNGRNNAMRINGLGAPRAFYTPVLRKIRIPNTSYGEDYAAGLAISRYYQIGRIMEPLYLCRRWDENSDAALDVVRMNAHNSYKDWIRTIELIARKNLVKQQETN